MIGAGATFFLPDTDGVKIHTSVAPMTAIAIWLLAGNTPIG